MSHPDHTIAFLVQGMTCAHCEAAVSEEVGKLPGVGSVHVDLQTKLVRVHGSEIDPLAIVGAIDEAGYDAVAA